MNIAKFVLVVGIMAVLSVVTSAEVQQKGSKVYKCGNEIMKLSELKDGRLELKGKLLTGYVSIHKPTGMYRGSVDGWGSQHKTPGQALEAACRRLLEKAKSESEEVLRKRLHDFYNDLK